MSNPSTMLYKEAQEILQFPRVNIGRTTPWFVIRTLGGELGPCSCVPELGRDFRNSHVAKER